MWKTAWITSPGLRWTVLLLTLASSTATAQSIAVERFTIPPPETAFQGRKYLIVARLTVADPPEDSSIGFVARYIGANIADTVSVDSRRRPLQGIEIQIPRRTCFPTVCPDPGPITVAGSLMEVPERVELIPVILDAQGRTLASGEATLVPVSKTGNVTIAPTNQPLQSRQRVRVTMEGANFTEGGATVFFRDTRDARGSDPIQTINWSAASNRRPVCGDMQPLRQVVSCAPEIISDTTFEFTIDSFLLPNDAARYDGQTFDIIAAGPAGSNVALSAFRFGGQSGQDSLNLEQLTISTDMEFRQLEPDSTNAWNLDPGAPLQVAPLFGYRLETQGAAQLALEVLHAGTGALLSSTPLGEPLPATGPTPETGREGASAFLNVPDPYEGLEFRLVLLELGVPAAAKPAVGSPKRAAGDVLATSGSVVVQPDQFTGSKDEVLGLDPLPPLDEPLNVNVDEGQVLQLTAEYKLRTEQRGDLILRVFDGRNIRIGASDPVAVERGDGTARLKTNIFTIPKRTNAVKMKIFMRDERGGILAESGFFNYKIPAELKIDHVEVVQVVQTKSNTVRLITVARVFTKALGEDPVRNVDVVLVGRRGDRDLGRLTEVGTSELVPDRRENRHSHNFMLPDSWITSGPLRLTAEVNEDKNPTERDFEDNKKIVDVEFIETEELRVGWVDLCVAFSIGEEVCPSSWKPNPDLALKKLYPIENPKIKMFALPGSPWRWTTAPVSISLLAGFLARMYILQAKLDEAFWLLASNSPDGVPPIDRLIAYVANERSFLNFGFGILGLGGRAGSRSLWMVNDTGNHHWTQFTVAHELGHTYGLDHPSTPDSNTAWNPFSIWPFESAVIQEHGYDPIESKLRERVKVGWPPTDSRVKYDFMTYRFNKEWMSEFYYRRLLQTFALFPGSAPVRQSVPRQVAFFSGEITRDGLTGTLEPALIFNTTAAPDQSNPDGDTCLEFSGEQGLISTHCFSVSFFESETGLEVDDGAFSRAVAFPDGVTLVALTEGGAELATLANSANAPTVEITLPKAGDIWDAAIDQTITWTGQDADGDPLVYDVSFSSDGGNTWMPLDLGALKETSFTFSPATIEGGSDVRFRVRARDGLRSTFAETGPIQVTQNPALQADDPSDLGRTAVGLSKVAMVELRNPGTGPVDVTGLEIDNPLFELVDIVFPLRIPAGARSAFQIRYAPDEVGVHEANVTATSTAADSPLVFVIRAECDDGQTPVLVADTGPLNFGPVPFGQANSYGLTLRNESLVEVTGTISVSGNGFSLGEPAADFRLAGGEEFVAELRYEPTVQESMDGEARIDSNDPTTPVRTVGLIGSGYELPSLGTSGPRISAGGVVDEASFGPLVVPGGIASLFGTNLADGVAIADRTPLPTALGGVRVLVNALPAPLFFVSPRQINFQVPFEADSPGNVDVVVTRNGEGSPSEPASMAEFAPAVFINPATGEPIIQRFPDGALITAANPAKPGDVLILFVTGIGGLSNPPATGAAAAASPLAQARVTPVVTVGGEATQVFFAGLAPFFVGLGQVNIQLPESLMTTGSTMPLVINFEGSRNPPVNLPVLGSAGGQGSGPIEIQLLSAELTIPEAGLLSYSWSAAFSDTRARSLRIDVVLSVDEQIGGADVVLLSENRETRQGQSGLGVQDVAIVPQNVPDGDYFIGILITDLGSGEESRSNVLPLEIAR